MSLPSTSRLSACCERCRTAKYTLVALSLVWASPASAAPAVARELGGRDDGSVANAGPAAVAVWVSLRSYTGLMWCRFGWALLVVLCAATMGTNARPRLSLTAWASPTERVTPARNWLLRLEDALGSAVLPVRTLRQMLCPPLVLGVLLVSMASACTVSACGSYPRIAINLFGCDRGSGCALSCYYVVALAGTSWTANVHRQ